MAYFNIDYKQFKPSSKKDGEPQASVSDRLQTNLKKFDVPSPTPQASATPILDSRLNLVQPQQKQSTIGRVVDILNKPSEITENFLTGGSGYEKRIEQFTGQKNVEGQLDVNDILSFGGRLVLDPLNFIPVGKVAGLLGKGASKIDDVAKISRAGEQAFSKVDDVFKLNKVKDFFGKKFVKGYQLPEPYNILKSEIPTRRGQATKQVVENIGQVFAKYGDLTDEAKDSVAKFLEPNFAGAGEDLGALKKSLEESGQWEAVSEMLTKSRKLLDQEVIDLVQKGRLSGEVAKDLLTRGGYFPHTDFASNSLKKFFGGREIGEKAWYLSKRKGAQGFTFNAPKAIAKRELDQLNNGIVQDFLRTTKESFGYKVSKGNPVKEGYTLFSKNVNAKNADNLITTPKALIELDGWAIPTRIAEDLNATVGVNNMLTRSIDEFNRLWKPTATAMNPSFHFMNVMGNMFNSWLGGMKDPKKYLQAVTGTFDEAEKAILEGSGILARGQFGADVVARTFDNPQGVQAIRGVERFRQVGEFFENNARSAFFLNSREKFIAQGLDEVAATRKAVQETNKYLFDYLSGLTPFETNIMRRIFPFYTWSRFNIPLQLQTIITEPQKYTPLTKLYEDINKGYEIPEDEQGLGFPTPFVDGNGNPIRWVPNLPVNDIFSLNRGRFANMINPLIKDGTQLAATAIFPGYEPIDTYTGRARTNRNLPAGEQIRDLFDPRRSSSYTQSLIRPIRSTTQFQNPDRRVESFLDLIIGGFYAAPEDRAIMTDLYESEGRNSAIRYKIRQVGRDDRLNVEQKRKEVDRLLKLMQ